MKTDFVTGAITYKHPDELTDILIGGTSYIHLQPVEAKVYPNGYGYIVCMRMKEFPDQEPRKMIDGQYLLHTYYGEIEIVP